MDSSFDPVFKIDPARQRNTVDGWALSFFETQPQALNRLKFILKSKPTLSKVLGTHIAKGVLEYDDGLCENVASSNGHFNHFEYVAIELWPKFTVVEKVV